MAKLTLSNVTNISGAESVALGVINANSDAIETALENTLSRDGTTPNSMGADLDMNNNDILNVDNIDANTITIDGAPVLISSVDTIITGITAAGLALIDDVDADAQLDTLGGSTEGIGAFKRRFEDFVEMKASSVASGGTGSLWLAGPYQYIEAASAAVDHHVTLDSGIKLYVVPGGAGVDVKAFGAAVDGVTDDTAALQASIDAAIATVLVPKGLLRTTATINFLTDSPSMKGVGKRYNADIASTIYIDHAGDGVLINGQSHIGTVFEDITFQKSVTHFAAGSVLNYDGDGGPSDIVAFTTLNRVYVEGGDSGIKMRGLINGEFNGIVCQGQTTAGIHFYGTGGGVNGSNNITFKQFNIYNVTGGAAIRYEGTDCGRNHNFKNGSIENCGRPIIIDTGDITQNIEFENLWLETNTNPMQIKGGRRIKFKNLRNAQAGQDLVDPSTFAGSDVEFDGVMGASVTSTLGLPGVSVKNFERSTRAWSMSVSPITESYLRGTLMPQTLTANQVSAASIVGAIHQSGMFLKNYLENWNIGGAAQWTKPSGVTAATDPLGGTEAWSIDASQTITGARSATIPDNVAGQTMEYVVWAKGVGTLELYSRGDGFAKRCEFEMNTQEWTRLTMRYYVEDTTNDRATTFGCIVTIASAGDISIWRPGIYAGLSCIDGRPVGASGGFEGVMPTGQTFGERRGKNLIVYGTAAPTSGTWMVGDECINPSPTAAGARRWICTTAGTPGTWAELVPSTTGSTAMTGTALAGALAAYAAGIAVPAVGAAFVQAEVNAIVTRLNAVELALQSAAQKIKRHDDALFTAGVLRV